MNRDLEYLREQRKQLLKYNKGRDGVSNEIQRAKRLKKKRK